MRHVSRTLAIAVVCACAVVASAAGSATAQSSEPISIFFLVQAEGARLTPTGPTTYRLRLTRASTTVYGFTDRPVRLANHATMQRFVSTWKRSDFVKTPPNAALVLSGADGAQTVVVAALSNPKWTQSTRLLRFDAKLLRDITSKQPSYYTENGKGPLPREFTSAKVFIDSFDPCNAPPAQGSGPRPPPAVCRGLPRR